MRGESEPAAEAQAANQVKLEQTQSILDNFAADLFQGGGGGSQMSVALGATSADDFATRVVLADQVTSLTDNALKELQNARSEASDAKQPRRAESTHAATCLTDAPRREHRHRRPIRHERRSRRTR